jgi:hypothetical protein
MNAKTAGTSDRRLGVTSDFRLCCRGVFYHRSTILQKQKIGCAQATGKKEDGEDEDEE